MILCNLIVALSYGSAELVSKSLIESNLGARAPSNAILDLHIDPVARYFSNFLRIELFVENWLTYRAQRMEHGLLE